MTSELPSHCTPTERWLLIFSSAFHVCVPTNLAFISTALGICSIISWLFAQLPQIYKNHKLKSASGLSIFFLAEWLLGDLTNLLGALFTDQAAWQVIIAAYYVTVDVCLLLQYVWYAHAKPWRKARLVDYGPDQDAHNGSSAAVLEGVSPATGSTPSADAQTKSKKEEPPLSLSPSSSKGAEPLQAVNLSQSSNEKRNVHHSQRTILYHQPSLLPSPRILVLITLICVALTSATPYHSHTMSVTPNVDRSQRASSAEFVGRIFSWTSTALYLLSRLPQIYKNSLRRSTSGLSPTLFIAAFFGNLFYSTSILTNPLAWDSYPPYGLHGWVGPEGSNRGTWVGLAAPFWLGAAGVLLMDAIIGLQFLYYGEGPEVVEVLLEQDSRGRSHWKRVTGWMRGWIPSPSPSGRIEVEEDGEEGRPLITRRRSAGELGEDGGRYGTTT